MGISCPSCQKGARGGGCLLYTSVMQFIEEKTGGRLSLGAGTLYGALNSLLEKKWIEPCGGREGRKKEYRITERGKEIAERELYRLRELAAVAAEIIGGGV